MRVVLRAGRRSTDVTRAARISACTIALIIGMASSGRVSAQEVVPTALGARSASTPVATDPSGWHVAHCMAGITYGAPLKLAVSYGMGLLHESDTGPDVCTLAVAKLGLGGAQGSVGVGTSFAPWGSGVMLTGNVLRTFGAPLKATPRRTYVGASVHVWPVLALGGELGYFVRVGDAAGASSSGERLVAWSVGFGF